MLTPLACRLKDPRLVVNVGREYGSLDLESHDGINRMDAAKSVRGHLG